MFDLTLFISLILRIVSYLAKRGLYLVFQKKKKGVLAFNSEMQVISVEKFDFQENLEI